MPELSIISISQAGSYRGRTSLPANAPKNGTKAKALRAASASAASFAAASLAAASRAAAAAAAYKISGLNYVATFGIAALPAAVARTLVIFAFGPDADQGKSKADQKKLGEETEETEETIELTLFGSNIDRVFTFIY